MEVVVLCFGMPLVCQPLSRYVFNTFLLAFTKWYALFAVTTLHRICNRFALSQEIDRKGLPEYPAAKHVQWNEVPSPEHWPEKSQNWVS